jgi:hypothetical protein
LPNIAPMSVEELLQLNPALAVLIAQRDNAIKYRDLKIAQLTHEMATLKRWTFGKRSEQLTSLERSLLDEAIGEDLRRSRPSSRSSLRRLRIGSGRRSIASPCRESCRASISPSTGNHDLWLRVCVAAHRRGCQ